MTKTGYRELLRAVDRVYWLLGNGVIDEEEAGYIRHDLADISLRRGIKAGMRRAYEWRMFDDNGFQLLPNTPEEYVRMGRKGKIEEIVENFDELDKYFPRKAMASV